MITKDAKKLLKPKCNHAWTYHKTMWEGVQDKSCRRCGEVEIGNIPRELELKLQKQGVLP